ncbi:MAG: hypothetical protein ACYCYF_04415 [Anaerolineae bacterium]
MQLPEDFDFSSIEKADDKAAALIELATQAMLRMLAPLMPTQSQFPGIVHLGGQRGPAPGQGVGPGKPWRGVVERVPCLWISWVVGELRRAGRDVPASIMVDGVRVQLASAHLTYGRRYYFVSPCCFCRAEALYLMNGRWACRRCHRLGYASQTHRPESVMGQLDRELDQNPGIGKLGRRYIPQSGGGHGLAEWKRVAIAERIASMLEHVSFDGAP